MLENQSSPFAETPDPIREEGDFCHVAFEASTAALLVLETGRMSVVRANPAAAALLGVEPEALAGMEFLAFLPDEAAVDGFIQCLPEFGEPGSVISSPPMELRVLHADGAQLPTQIVVSTCRLANGHPGFLLALTRDLSSNDSSHTSRSAVYQRLIECIGDGFLALGDDEVIIYANESAARILARPVEELHGRRLFDIFPQLDAHDLSVALKHSTDNTQSNPLRVPIFLGCELHQFEFGIQPYHGGTSVLFRDVSERVKQEMEIAKLNATMAISQQLLRAKNEELNHSLDKLAKLNEQLANADQLKGEFLANTSHELRTPLNSIIGFLQLITEGLCENREEELTYIDNAQHSAQQLLSLINDVLDIAKIEAGKMTLLINDIDLEGVFHETFIIAQVQTKKKGIKLILESLAENCRYARADFHKVKQILINLVGNSIKFTSKGHVRIWAEPDHERADMLRISVEDTGIGVVQTLQTAIFEKFTQVDGSATRKYQGTGLGLAISRNLVEMMGGSIGIFSDGPGKGTTLYFTLPAGRCPAPNEDQDADLDIEEALPTTF